MQKISSSITYLLIALAVGIFLAVAIPKILFPYEAHWMEGSMLDAVTRILNGIHLYAKPNIHYVPWLYEPLYYYVTAGIAKIFGLTFFTARIPSILSTLAICIILYFVIRKETGKFYYAIAAVGLFIASYAKTEFCLVMARVDPLFTLFVVSAFVAVYYSRSNLTLIAGAILLSLSYFTKQTGLVFAPSIILYLWFFRGWKPAIIFSITVAFVIFVGMYVLDLYYGGWYSFYTVLVPRGKGKELRWGYAIDGFIVYIFIRCWLESILLTVIPVKILLSGRKEKREGPIVFFGIFFITSVLAGFLGILNNGGGHNVLLPVAAACGIFLPLMAEELSGQGKYVKISLWLIPIQLAFLISNPWKDPRNIVTEVDKKRMTDFFAYTASLRGDIWIPYRGYTQKYVGKGMSAEYNAMKDIFLVGDSTAYRLKNELDTAFANHHWSYIFGELPEKFPYYRFIGTMRNPNKMFVNDDTLMYIYQPEQ